MDPREEKSLLRNAIKERLARMSAKDRSAESRSLCRRILESLPKGLIGIAAYYPLTDEADIRPLLKELPTRGHSLHLPRKEGPHFVFRRMESVEALAPDDFGIPAPPATAPLLEPRELAIALVPGRAFDSSGHRLGRGNGGYDIWIRQQRKENPATRFWGVALECQIVQELPMEAHDETVDAIVTARGLQQCGGKVQNN